MTNVTIDYETTLALADAPRSLREYIAALQAENDSLWSTYVALVDKLGIDTEKAKTADGKPSDVIVSYVDKLRAENDRLRGRVASCAVDVPNEKPCSPPRQPAPAQD